MNILITGGSGFIGRHLIKLMSAKNNVFALSRKNVLFEPYVTTIVADFVKDNYTKLLPQNIDCVIHLAQSERYRDFPEGVSDMLRVNVDAIVELLEWSRLTGVKQFLLTSTANVYAPSLELLTETSQVIPISFYGASKLSAEHLARHYHKFFQVDILRCFTVYGSGQQNMLIANIIQRVKQGQEITLAKGVGIYLTPIYVSDIVDIIHRVLALPKTTESRLLNACGDYVTSLAEIVKVIERITDRNAFVKITDEEPTFFTGSNEKLRKLVGKLSLLPIEQGLELTINMQPNHSSFL